MENLYMDPDAANRLRGLILERLQRSANSPGISHKKGKYGEVYRFLVGDRVFVEVQVYKRKAESSQCHDEKEGGKPHSSKLIVSSLPIR